MKTSLFGILSIAAPILALFHERKLSLVLVRCWCPVIDRSAGLRQPSRRRPKAYLSIFLFSYLGCQDCCYCFTTLPAKE
ncbi:hypothetical protein BY458DRAFT_523380 [Sporodiniella umbellata]|nr:hypothetical protein BY458DRAFT_525240 [Sporodiniella umbellata]KAI9252118.1 hypothetical protein BY458DRAFT_523380 [Sporodiniella umbellata]